ncbi:MAG: DUF1905 domain-containing protein [Actinomycetota bacterium]|nr:DUF1905 domain-containing protein [Actinomycetota bacterium]
MDEFESELWSPDATDPWVFATLPPDLSDDIRAVSGPPRGFGSVRVEVTLGTTTWRTSVFPDAKSGCFVLPVKKAVRLAEDVEVGEIARIGLQVIDG